MLGYLAVVLSDILLKAWCAANIKDGGDIPLLPGIIRLTYTENRGAAFSILQNARWFFVWLGVATIIGLLALMRFDKHLGRSRIGLASLTLLLAGTTGNLIDRILQGYVVDMFMTEFINFAIFNVADIALTCGGVMVCAYVLFSGAYKREPDGADSAETPDESP